jgi:hypothetical protein
VGDTLKEKLKKEKLKRENLKEPKLIARLKEIRD